MELTNQFKTKDQILLCKAFLDLKLSSIHLSLFSLHISLDSLGT